jgi:hypothetical protein
MSEGLNENTSSIVISGWAQLHKMLVNSRQAVSYSDQVVQWINMGSTLNQGCGCTRKQREAALDAGYKSMGVYLNGETKSGIKAFYAADKITLKSNDLEFLSF